MITCALYQNDAVTLVLSLTDCKIPANTMTFPNTYKIKFTATNPADGTQTIIQWSDIHVSEAELSVFIEGGDRSISTEINNIFIANVEPKKTTMIYRWK